MKKPLQSINISKAINADTIRVEKRRSIDLVIFYMLSSGYVAGPNSLPLMGTTTDMLLNCNPIFINYLDSTLLHISNA